MDHPVDIETNQLRILIEQFNRICSTRRCPENELSPQVPDSSPTALNSLFQAIFQKLYDILNQLRAISEEERRFIEESGTTKTEEHNVTRQLDSEVALVQELLVRVQTNISNERNRAEEVINYLLERQSQPAVSDDPCVELLGKLKTLESMYSLLKDQLNAVTCELQMKSEQLSDREIDFAELSEKLVACYNAFENAKNDLLNCQSSAKRNAVEAADAKAKLNETKKYADLALEQTAAVMHERDQAHKLIEHLQSRVHSLEKENVAMSSKLRDIEKLYSDMSVEQNVLVAELGRASEKEQETERNVVKIMQESAERIQAETERVRNEMQRDIEAIKTDNDRLTLEITEWRLKYDQCQRDYRNVEAIYDQLHSSVANSTQAEAAEKAEAIRRAAAAECARDEALFVKQQLSLKVEKLELALRKTSERYSADLKSKQSRIDELQRQVSTLTDECAKCCQEKTELERGLSETREKVIEIEMQYRYKVIAAEENARTTVLACDAKMSTVDEAHRKLVNNLARELNLRQSVINQMMDDGKRRCGDVEDKVEELQNQLREEQSHSRELTRVRADQARRIASLEDQLASHQRLIASFKAAHKK